VVEERGREGAPGQGREKGKKKRTRVMDAIKRAIGKLWCCCVGGNKGETSGSKKKNSEPVVEAALNEPITAKVSSSGESSLAAYGATCMQGWRMSELLLKCYLLVQKCTHWIVMC
jgi:hypothetical protein